MLLIRFFLKVSKYLLDHRRVFDTRDYVQGCTNATGLADCRRNCLQCKHLAPFARAHRYAIRGRSRASCARDI